jgi:hypothetical protein
LHAATDLTNEQVIPAHEIFGDSVYDLRKQMASAADTQKVFALMEVRLLNGFDKSILTSHCRR